MGIRRKSRELALQALYQGDLSGTSPPDALPLLCTNFEISCKSLSYSRELLDGIRARLAAIDAIIEGSAVNWRISRMSVIDRNIMRIAVYEFRFRDDVPAKVAINEAIELAKRFGADDSPAFINGILDAVHKTRL
ncbi:MAG: transcription antitermination factor NusB [Desulfobulbaceae bacterium]|nr:MAG: transcription antitermination factor NusB [Desulfobulbaceae bacterium]